MTEIKQIFRTPEQFLEQKLEVAGWVRNIRVSKKFGFIELNDGSFFQNLQIVFEEDLGNFEEIAKLGVGTAVIVQGLSLIHISAFDSREDTEELTLSAFLAEVALFSDLDQMDDEEDSVTIMTMHGAKGLEFPVVFITGMEEGVFPHNRAIHAMSPDRCV